MFISLFNDMESLSDKLSYESSPIILRKISFGCCTVNILFALFGCASDDSSALETTSTVSISSSLNYGKAALTSAGNSTNSTNTFGISSTLAETQSTTDPTCTTVGSVYKSGETDNRMPASNAEYPLNNSIVK